MKRHSVTQRQNSPTSFVRIATEHRPCRIGLTLDSVSCNKVRQIAKMPKTHDGSTFYGALNNFSAPEDVSRKDIHSPVIFCMLALQTDDARLLHGN